MLIMVVSNHKVQELPSVCSGYVEKKEKSPNIRTVLGTAVRVFTADVFTRYHWHKCLLTVLDNCVGLISVSVQDRNLPTEAKAIQSLVGATVCRQRSRHMSQWLFMLMRLFKGNNCLYV
jgi:hypothetical protein